MIFFKDFKDLKDFKVLKVIKKNSAFTCFSHKN